MIGRVVVRLSHATEGFCNPRSLQVSTHLPQRNFSSRSPCSLLASPPASTTRILGRQCKKRRYARSIDVTEKPQSKTNMATSTWQAQMSTLTKKDWSADQYLKFSNERTRPVRDLVAQIQPLMTTAHPRIYDLGCGPGNSTEVLADAFPGAYITGMDSSPDMLKKARATFEARSDSSEVTFEQGDVESYTPEAGADLLFSNAVFHWLRSPKRIDVLTALLQGLKPGGVLAFQVPDNYTEDSHSSMRAVAQLPDRAWSPSFRDAAIGDLEDAGRPDLDPIESPAVFYKAFIPHCASVQLWRTQYQHVLGGPGAIVEWVKGTGLQPYLNRIEDEGVKKEFLNEYEGILRGKYQQIEAGEGKEVVLLQYPRLFVVAVRK